MKNRAFNNIYKKFLYVPKHAKLPDKVFRFRMIFSLLAIIAYATLMVSFSFALFNSEVTSNNSTIISAYYDMTVTNNEVPLVNGEYTCVLRPSEYADNHTFVLTASGTASTGYCEIKIGETSYHTVQMAPGDSITLTVQAASGTMVKFIPQWGTSSSFANGGGFYGDKATIVHSATNVAYYTVEPTAKLSNIAAHYGVSEEDIIIYNNLSTVIISDVEDENASTVLTVGMELKIPNPVENVDPYKVPYATYSVEPTATLEAISEHYGISVEDINAFNEMTAFGVGMELKIPNTAENADPYKVSYTTYIVEPTATLLGIAEHYNVTEADILLYNNITEIAVDMLINIPGVSLEYPSYAAPVEDPSSSADDSNENNNSEDVSDSSSDNTDITTGDEEQNQSPENENQPTDDPASSGDTGTDEPSIQDPVNDESVSLYVGSDEHEYKLTTVSMMILNNADILIYKSENENLLEYSKELDLRITGLETNSGEYFCTIVTNVEKLSLCFEITENIEQGYLRIIIGESEYYTVQITKDSYVLLDIEAPIGSEIRFEAYAGISPVSVTGGVLYGDDLNDTTDGNSAWLYHTASTPVVDPSPEGGNEGEEPNETPAPESGNEEGQPEDELAVSYVGTYEDFNLITESQLKLGESDIIIYKGHDSENEEEYQKDLDLRITGLEVVEDIENKTGEYFCKLLMKAEKLSLCFKITENIEQGYLKIIIGENEYFTVQIEQDSYVRLDIVAPIDTEILIEAYAGELQASIDGKVLYGDNLNDDTDECNALLDYTLFIEQQAVEPASDEENNESSTDESDSSEEDSSSGDGTNE